MRAGIVADAWAWGFIAGEPGRVTNLQEVVRVAWSRIRKEPDGRGRARICKASGGKDEARQGFYGVGVGRFPDQGSAGDLLVRTSEETLNFAHGLPQDVESSRIAFC